MTNVLWNSLTSWLTNISLQKIWGVHTNDWNSNVELEQEQAKCKDSGGCSQVWMFHKCCRTLTVTKPMLINTYSDTDNIHCRPWESLTGGATHCFKHCVWQINDTVLQRLNNVVDRTERHICHKESWNTRWQPATISCYFWNVAFVHNFLQCPSYRKIVF